MVAPSAAFTPAVPSSATSILKKEDIQAALLQAQMQGAGGGAGASERQISQSVFLTHIFSHVILQDQGALSASGASTKVSGLQRVLLWILIAMAAVFAVDICGFAVLSNHLHLVLRIRPDVAQEWSDEDVVRRWWRLFPHRDSRGATAELERHLLTALLADRQRLAEWRKRLCSLSWFMRSLCEPIARRANREDGCSGRFWEGRFKSQALLDEAAVLACSMYVDLNPIRAGVADRPETSEFTSAFE